MMTSLALFLSACVTCTRIVIRFLSLPLLSFLREEVHTLITRAVTLWIDVRMVEEQVQEVDHKVERKHQACILRT
jgi:uncharacterized membrane protein YvlD (DUF360 family)